MLLKWWFRKGCQGKGYWNKEQGNSRCLVTNVLDCNIVVSEFELQSIYYVHVRTNTPGKGMNPHIFPFMGYIVQLLFFYKNGFGIEYSMKDDMPLNNEIETETKRLLFDTGDKKKEKTTTDKQKIEINILIYFVSHLH